MVATLKTDVIEKSDGSPVDLTGQVSIKSYVVLLASTVATLDSLNISSIVDHGSGPAWTANFTNSFSNDVYHYFDGGELPSGAFAITGQHPAYPKTASYARFLTMFGNVNGVTYSDPPNKFSMDIVGDLA
jgi:hypothetical protein